MYFKLNDTFSIYRSRNTGRWGLWQRNSAYGYDAALRYWGEHLTLSNVQEAAELTGLSSDLITGTIESVVRVGRKGRWAPDPEFVFTGSTAL